MLKKCLVITATVFTAMCLFVPPSFSAMKSVDSYDSLYSILPGAGVIDNSEEIKMAMRYVERLQLQRNRRVVKYIKPKEILTISPKYIAISIDATVKKQGNARYKEVPAVFMFLFEVENLNTMTFYKNMYLVWIGTSDLEEYAKTTPERFCEHFRAEGAEYVYMVKDKAKPSVAEIRNLDGSKITSGIIDEQYIDSKIARDSELTKALQPYALKKSLQTFQAKSSGAGPESAKLEAKIDQLEKKIQKLEYILNSVRRKGNDIIFSGVNIRVENGTGSTSKVNGTGNIVVGYGSAGSGSHNVAIGSRNKYSSYGGLVSGEGNEVTNKYSAIAGGNDNRAVGQYSTILGGEKNLARGKYSSINGQSNRIKGGENPHLIGD